MTLPERDRTEVSVSKPGYVSITQFPRDYEVQSISIHHSDIQRLIAMLSDAGLEACAMEVDSEEPGAKEPE